MARNDRRRSRQLFFSGSSNRLDTKRYRGSSTDRHPISPTFSRKIIYCHRCGSRVVSNVSHCPYCGKNLLPIFKRLWFWLIVVAVIGGFTIGLIIFGPPSADDGSAINPPAPIVIGAPEGTSAKTLTVGTTIDCEGLLVTVIDIAQVQVASNGTPLIQVSVRFQNRSSDSLTIYSTQWTAETVDGSRVDGFIGKNDAGESVKSDLDTKDIAPDSSFDAKLYFALSNPKTIVFAPNVLSYNVETDATWTVPQDWRMQDPADKE